MAPKRVGGAGTCAGDQDAGLAGGASVSVGHEAATQFQPAADEAQVVLLVVKGVEKVQVMYADDAEDSVHTLGLQGLSNGLTAGQVGHGRTPRLIDLFP